MKEFDPGTNAASIVSVTDRVRPLAIGMPVIAVHFLGENIPVQTYRALATRAVGEVVPTE